MIDFRYHIVSIVSIFLALAVGIVLGAGPLQGELGSTLANEVSGLREDKVNLNEQLDDATTGIEARDGYIGESAPLVLDGILADRAVAVVVLPGLDAGVVDTLDATLRSTGARLVSTTTVDEDWVSTDEETTVARDEAVSTVATEAGIDLSDTGSASGGDSLLSALLANPVGQPGVPLDSETAAAGLATLADAGLVQIDTQDFARADLVVVAGGEIVPGTDEDSEIAQRWVDLVVAIDARSAGALVAGQIPAGGEGAGSLVAAVRNDTAAVEVVSTVDDSADPMGQSSVAHGLLQQDDGGVGHYGFAAGADAPYAPIPAP
ncbi:MAG: copper transporter [Ornithinibacter sp.]